jgi:flagellin
MSTINTNVQSLNAQRNLSASTGSLSTSMQRLSSGMRVNSAKDDAAGLAISERMNSQVKGMNVAIRNANDAISLVQTAEGALGKVGDMLQRVRELAVQSVNATNSDSDRASLQAEAAQLKLEIDRVADQTKFNGIALLSGSFKEQVFQVGANQGETIGISEIANTKIGELGEWDSVIIPSNSGASGKFTEVALADGDEFTFSISYTKEGADDPTDIEIFTATGSEDLTKVTAADIDKALKETATLEKLKEAGISFTGSAAKGNLTFLKADAGEFTITVENDATDGGFAADNFKSTEGAEIPKGTASEPKTGFADIDISTVDGANNAIVAMDAALNKVNESRGELGAIQSRFENAIATLQVNSENLSSARGRIVDADFAKETANLSRAQILQQAGTAMIAQANQLPQGVLSLLR